jgi:hypothetical protein
MSQPNVAVLKANQYVPPIVYPSNNGSVNGYSAVDMNVKEWRYREGHIYNKDGLMMKFPHMQFPNNLTLNDAVTTTGLVISIFSMILGLAMVPYGLILFGLQFVNFLIVLRMIKFPGILINEFNQYTKHPLKFIVLMMNVFTLIAGIFLVSFMYWNDYFFIQEMLTGIFSIIFGLVWLIFSFTIFIPKGESKSTQLMPKGGFKKLMEMAKIQKAASAGTSLIPDESILQEIADGFINSR